MSVALLIKYVHPRSDKPTYVPVATEAVFSRFWQPAARKLGCRWIPEFQGGVCVPAKDWPEVIREFRLIRDFFAATTATDPAWTEELRERSRLVVDVLAGLDATEVRELFIG